ncbi:hypothetical protein [Streptomyces sp. FIT100]|uniref:hypothetical protein n=1 Tax=Streptomyces sp. FIT100 TaxID=2837956 RepID=UPI0021C70F40|nr:hypothetical protein [Streptomyces sp. FIT100]UUN24996.1 hypothetical protein KK483_00075 [Streptomyces sp. FIT100]
MDATEHTRHLLYPVPAHRTARIEVVSAVDGAAQVALETPPELTNVIGSLHSSGLITLVDAAGLGRVSKVAPSARRAGPTASGACDRKAKGRSRTGRTWTTPTTQRACVPGVVGQAGLSKHALAAIIAAAEHPEQCDGLVPLGAAASLRFTAPARGRLLASCRLSRTARAALRPVLTGEVHRANFSTRTETTDADDTLVCWGDFDWSVRRST